MYRHSIGNDTPTPTSAPLTPDSRGGLDYFYTILLPRPPSPPSKDILPRASYGSYSPQRVFVTTSGSSEIQPAVSILKPPHGAFGTETAVMWPFQFQKRNGYEFITVVCGVTAMYYNGRGRWPKRLYFDGGLSMVLSRFSICSSPPRPQRIPVVPVESRRPARIFAYRTVGLRS